jgi:hypothetical protein
VAVADRLLDKTGIALGAATPMPAGLAQLFTVRVTVYVPAVVTVMELVVAPVFHNNEPVPVAVNTELPQLLVTETVGAEGMEVTVNVAALEFTVPPMFVHTARYSLLLSAVVVVNDSGLAVAPVMLFQLVPLLVLTCHCTVGAGLPLAAELKLAFKPAHLVCVNGWVVTTGATALVPTVTTKFCVFVHPLAVNVYT